MYQLAYLPLMPDARLTHHHKEKGPPSTAAHLRSPPCSTWNDHTATTADYCDTRPPLGTNATRPSPLKLTQLTNNGQTMPTQLIHVFNFHHQSTHTRPVFCKQELVLLPPLFCTHTDTNDYIYSRCIVPLTLYPT